MTISSFTLYTEAMQNFLLSSKNNKKTYNLTAKFNTTIKPLFINNFDKETFLQEKLSKKGEAKFKKGLWQFHLTFEYNISSLNASMPIPPNALCTIDFGLKTLLDGDIVSALPNETEASNKPPMKATGTALGVIQYTFQIPIEKDNALFMLEIEPQAWQHLREIQEPSPLAVNYVCSLTNVYLIGEQKIVYTE